MAYLDRGGVRIFYQVRGPSDGGLPLLLTHGFSASSAMWQPNIAALAAVRPVITWDLRGHVGAAGYLAAKLPRAAHAVIPPPARFSATPASVRRPAPLAGQHTREVLADAGLTDPEITRLAEAGVLGHVRHAGFG